MNLSVAKERLAAVVKPDSITASQGDFLTTHVAIKKLVLLNKFEFVPVDGETVSLSIKDIPDMSVYSRNGFVFSDAAGIHYEIKSIEKKSPLNVRKYISVWKNIRSLSESKGHKE